MVGSRAVELKEPTSLEEAVAAVEGILDRLARVAKRWPQLPGFIHGRLRELMGRLRGYSVAVSSEMVERFERLLKAKAAGAVDNHLRYLRRALADLG